MAFVARQSTGNDTTDTCVSCHRGLPKKGALGHTFAEWQQSVHAKSGVSCQGCHGGDPSRPSKAEAHAGILGSTDPKSPIYYKNVPQTCGACHAGEFNAFKKSTHYNELKSTGRGPTCVTCHGSMANKVIGPREMEMTCTLCHHEPTQAYSARMAVEQSRRALRQLDTELQKNSKVKSPDLDAQRKSYATLMDRFHGLKLEWHTFNMTHVLSTAQELTRQASAGYTKLKQKTRKL